MGESILFSPYMTFSDKKEEPQNSNLTEKCAPLGGTGRDLCANEGKKHSLYSNIKMFVTMCD